ncbi:DUF2711 domain-containing protein [Rossellomorea vietnamensis]|uniref:DUF2711 domain-containing protein n=1 Tax=Rossellomorea vietnamensis TaxID=218284 RepID=A0ACD4CDE5_9BACI|nr:DUF2711 domain-containing protein [Rossellomorea vietnamensis]UXH46522.1 DUF2711 domain-containing protein [Rossellomorea vietnamensis]
MSKVRVLPKPHLYAVCADADIPIKEFYRDAFEEVFIFFHPFIKPLSIDFELFNPDTYPGKREIVNTCEKMTWNEFLDISGLSNLAEVDIGLRSIILGLNKKYENKTLANRIIHICEEKKIVFPSEGLLPELVIEDVLRAMEKEGYEWIWCGDEFCTERKLEYMDDVINDDGIILHRDCRNLFTHDQKILVTTHWDSHFSMICGERKMIKRIVESADLEGFFCDEETEIYWSLKEGAVERWKYDKRKAEADPRTISEEKKGGPCE